MQQVQERFKRLAEHWFLTEPAFLSIYGSHALTPNPCMECPVRSGLGRLEFNPELIAQIENDRAFEELVRVEMLRLFLKHPYSRKPEHTPLEHATCASDLVLESSYTLRYAELHQAAEFHLPKNKHYEWYLAHLPKPPPENSEEQEQDPDTGSGQQQEAPSGGGSEQQGQGAPGSGEGDEPEQTQGESGSGGQQPGHAPAPQAPTRRQQDAATSALWEEDEAHQQEINQLIESIKNWGSIPGELVQEIIASTKGRIDYRKVLSAFRASVLSQERRLTRMQPNRRTGFAYMGSRRAFSTSLLLAVDVSLSITNEMLSHFYSVINKFFKYGISRIDVIQFDTEIKGEVRTLRDARRQKKIDILGRGGTNFQPVFDYVEEHRQYDGLIILTDGYAPPPARKPRGKVRVAWICEDEDSYNTHHHWMEKLGKACFMNLR